MKLIFSMGCEIMAESFELIALFHDRDESVAIFKNPGNAYKAMESMKAWYPGMRIQKLNKKYPKV